MKVISFIQLTLAHLGEAFHSLTLSWSWSLWLTAIKLHVIHFTFNNCIFTTTVFFCIFYRLCDTNCKVQDRNNDVGYSHFMPANSYIKHKSNEKKTQFVNCVSTCKTVLYWFDPRYAALGRPTVVINRWGWRWILKDR